ncbi:MAG TPA: 4'-phosphopantetheinyl transferase superfamily protein [Acidobacteriota bacterium]|nr:4'-phosphopantetheinyl transferase superfamily protein [Acidobacteriota bacterium]
MKSGRIEVWPVWLQASRSTLESLHAYLDPQEKVRKASFYFQRLRDSYTLSQGALRLLLAAYTGMAPGRVRLRYGARGKPSLASRHDLQFNASHSGGLALYAFADGLEIGVDVEELRPLPDYRAIARSYFCAREWRQLDQLPAEEQQQAFFLCWTRKEAYLKAVGEGLALPLDSFQVTLRPGEKARMVQLGDDERAARRWTLHNLAPAPGYAAALAYRAPAREVVLHPPCKPAQLLDRL